MIASKIASSTPIFFKNIPMATTIAVIIATNKKIGFIKMVAPSFTNAPPTVDRVPMNPLKPLAKSPGLSFPITLLNT